MRFSIVAFSMMVLLGQILTAIGCSTRSMAIMLLGRLIFGLGGECIVVGQSAFISAWFQGREIAFALGFILSLSRIGRCVRL
jgi:MFS family permease